MSESEHHVVPKSRGGGRVCSIPLTFHEAWHTLFNNLYDDEVISFVKEVQHMMRVRKEITSKDVYLLREEIRR